MKRVIKWIAIIVGALVGILLVVGIGGTVYANSQFKADVGERPLYEITADTSAEGMERGVYLMEEAMLCAEACHASPDGHLSGNVENINEGPIAAVFAIPNLTPDEATGLGSWTDAEIARAIREGVDKDGVALEFMPSYNYNALSDDDVAAVVGYLRNMEAVQNEIPPLQLNTAAKVMAAAGMMGPEALQEPITERQDTPSPGTLAYGEYMVKLGACSDCHQENLAGGPLPFAGPGEPPSANLTPAGDLAGWSSEEFVSTVRTGIRPDGIDLYEGMPRYQMSEEDLTAVFEYLQTIPAVTNE